MALITYEMAINHLKLNGILEVSPEDPDLAAKVEQASAITLMHLKREGEWDESTHAADDREFAMVQATVLRVLEWLYRFRGGEDEDRSLEDIFRNSGTSMLRDPSLA